MLRVHAYLSVLPAQLPQQGRLSKATPRIVPVSARCVISVGRLGCLLACGHPALLQARSKLQYGLGWAGLGLAGQRQLCTHILVPGLPLNS